jgi:hypothetical protein
MFPSLNTGLALLTVEARMIGRSGFHGLLRNLRVSPWTRRSLTESLLLRRAQRTSASRATDAGSNTKQLSPSASLTSRAWQAAVSMMLQKKTVDKDNHP